MNIRLKAMLLTLAAPVAVMTFGAVLALFGPYYALLGLVGLMSIVYLVSTYTGIRDELLAEQRLREEQEDKL